MYYVALSGKGVYYVTSEDFGCIDYVYKTDFKSAAFAKARELNNKAARRRAELRKELNKKKGDDESPFW